MAAATPSASQPGAPAQCPPQQVAPQQALLPSRQPWRAGRRCLLGQRRPSPPGQPRVQPSGQPPADRRSRVLQPLLPLAAASPSRRASAAGWARPASSGCHAGITRHALPAPSPPPAAPAERAASTSACGREGMKQSSVRWAADRSMLTQCQPDLSLVVRASMTRHALLQYHVDQQHTSQAGWAPPAGLAHMHGQAGRFTSSTLHTVQQMAVPTLATAHGPLLD